MVDDSNNIFIVFNFNFTVLKLAHFTMDVCTLVSLEMVIKTCSCLTKVKENKRAETNIPASLIYQTKCSMSVKHHLETCYHL